MHGAECRFHALLGQGLGSGGRGDSSSGRVSHAATLAALKSDEGLLNPDGETHLVSMPPLLLVAAHQFMMAASNRLLWVPLLKRLTGEWHTRELDGVSILVAKLLFWHDVLLKPVVSLRELMGGDVDIGGPCNVVLCPRRQFFRL